MTRRTIDPRERGALAAIGSVQVLRALQSVTDGRIFELDPGRYPGMPQADAHPQFTMLSHRTPAGTAIAGDFAGLADPSGRPAPFRWATEILITSMHMGAHLDGFAHISGEDGKWWGGYPTNEHLGDFGANRVDGSTLPAIVLPVVVLDVARHRGVARLDRDVSISAEQLDAVATAQQTPIVAESAVVIRTGLMSLWNDPPAFSDAGLPGIDEGAARWLVDERGVVLVGGDTPTIERAPREGDRSLQPVHELLLRGRGVHMLELIDLEHVSAERVMRGVLVCLPLRIEGTTGSMVRPIIIT